MNDKAYSDLCKHLDKHVFGAPEAGPILEILRILFTPEEAELAFRTLKDPASRLKHWLELEEIEGNLRGSR